MGSIIKTIKFIIIFSLLASTTVASQEEVDGSTVIYGQDYFAPLKPVTLEDIIRNIPGGVSMLGGLKLASMGRGFGSTGTQILINGKRISGKANDMLKKITRTQASQVDYVELIRGTAEGLDVRSEGILFNIILKEGDKNTSSTFVEGRINHTKEIKVTPEILISHNGSRGNFEYGLSYQYDRLINVQKLSEDVFNADLSPREFRLLQTDKIENEHILTGNMAYNFANGDRVRLNGLYSDKLSSEEGMEDQFLIGFGGLQIFNALDEAFRDFDNEKWEIGGDYEGQIGKFGNIKALFVINENKHRDVIERNLVSDGVRNNYFSSTADYVQAERIFRTSISTSFGQDHTLDYGAEGAFNKLDKAFVFGGSNDTAIVKEARYEIFGTHSYKINDRMDLSSSLVGEFSNITQERSGIVNSTKFQYLKPRFEYRYNATEKDQFRLVADRSVSQLDLNQFVASRNLEDETINFGNPDLEPEKTWKYSVGYERRFDDDSGSVEFELYYEDISDHIDKILIGTNSSGTGNIGKAKRYGLDFKGNLRFGFIGVPNAMISAEYNYKKSDTIDPFTGESRWVRMAGTHRWSVDFQHDIIDWDVTWGFNVHRRSAMFRQDVNLREKMFYKRHTKFFIEYRFTENMKIYFEALHVLKDLKFFDKTYYQDNIYSGVVDRIENQVNRKNPDYFLVLKATF